MSQERIKLSIDHLGRPKVEAEGFVGTSCMQATAGIEKALGADRGKSTDLKPEFYQLEKEEQTLTTTW